MSQDFRFYIIVLLSLPYFLHCQVDTIKLYQNTSNPALTLNTFKNQYVRIKPQKSGKLHGLKCIVGGPETGEIILNIYGHEGGAIRPILKQKLSESIIINKNKKGLDTILVKFKHPINILTEQYFLAFEHINKKIGLLQDTTRKVFYCKSAEGGNFTPLVLQDTLGKFSLVPYYPLIDLYFESTKKGSNFFELDTTIIIKSSSQLSKSISSNFINEDDYLDFVHGKELYINHKGFFKSISLKTSINASEPILANAIIDLNHDAKNDIILFSKDKTVLLLNQGDLVFTEVDLNLQQFKNISSVSFGDINSDGHDDLLVTQLWDRYPVPLPNYLFLNNGALGFTDVTNRLYPQYDGIDNYPNGKICTYDESSTHLPNRNKNKRSRAGQIIDLNNDGFLDVLIANYYIEKDEAYLNDGKGKYTKLKDNKLLDGNNHGTGILQFDYDNDQDMDILITQLAHPKYMLDYGHEKTILFENLNNQSYIKKKETGIEYEETHAGATTIDINNDGLQDLITTAHYGCRYIDVYIQNELNKFENNSTASGLNQISTDINPLSIDINNDGAQDLLIQKEDSIFVYKNNLSKNNWIQILLQRKAGSNTHSINGIKVKVFTKRKTYTKCVSIGRELVQEPTLLHFGLADSRKIKKIEVFWSHSEKEIFKTKNLNKSITLIQGTGKTK